jgi:hypothetical protein
MKRRWWAGPVIDAFYGGQPMGKVAQRFHIKKHVVEEIVRAYAIGKAAKRC